MHTIKKEIDHFTQEIREKKLHKTIFMMQFDNAELDAEHIQLFYVAGRKKL